MPSSAEGALIDDLVSASRILAREDVVDGFGHVSARSARRPDRFLLSRARAPELVEAGDVLEFGPDGEPVAPTPNRVFAERIIHAAIYAARPDVMAVCHHHAPAILPFCITDVKLEPVYHLGATMGPTVAMWDSRDEFGETNLLVATPEQGASLARALGPHWTVLMRRHGATVAGRSLREVVFRSIYGARNAVLLARARLLGAVETLAPAERLLAEEFNLKPIAVDRAWEQWVRRSGSRAGNGA